MLWLMLSSILPHAIAAQTAPKTSSDPSNSNSSLSGSSPAVVIRDETVVPATIHGAIKINNSWRFRAGDDPAWANPDFDDSGWDKIDLTQTFAEQGIESFSGYAWYRLRIRPAPVPESGALSMALLVVPNSVGQLQVLINGVEAGRTSGMSDRPAMYQSPPFTVAISRAGTDGSVVIAIRSWAGQPFGHGPLRRVEIGNPESTGEKLNLERDSYWDKHVLAEMILSFLFFGVTVLGTTLYLAQRNHQEYLWLALLCLSVTLRACVETAFGLAFVSLSTFQILNPWATWIFIAVTLEFVLHFTGNHWRRLVRVMQVASLLLPAASMLHFEETFKYLSLASQFLFCGLIVVMLFRSWRRGRPEAGVMLLPFFLAATADSSNILLDFAANRSWIPARFASQQFYFGSIQYTISTVTYLVFLGSLIAVILYRFVHVSQEEQRSAAEIDAARSVQALLIPTQLPSNRNFMLESAYLPANGVGGDFFQVLPLKDDSMLIVVGDVSGKGLQAAMNASTLVGALRNELSHDPATVLSHLNVVMLGATSGPVAGFATCLCARIYPSGKMIIANAGHLSPYRDGREMELAACLPLGVIPNVEYEQSTFQLNHGDRLTFVSDGVVEATDQKGELFGFERTQQVSHEPARYIAQIAQRFGQTDDITVVSLYFVPA
jgi:stage II sporulation SpoE-like protein